MTDKKQPEVLFNHWRCVIAVRFYSNGRTALRLMDAETGEPVATATINLVREPLAPNEVIIKDYSENAGMRECLESAGVIGPVVRVVNAGHTTATVHALLI